MTNHLTEQELQQLQDIRDDEIIAARIRELTGGTVHMRLVECNNNTWAFIPMFPPLEEEPEPPPQETKSMLYVIKFGDTELSGGDLLALHDKAAQQQETDSPAYSVKTYEDWEDRLLDSIHEEFHDFLQETAARISSNPTSRDTYRQVLERLVHDLRPVVNNFEMQITAETTKRIRDEYQ